LFVVGDYLFDSTVNGVLDSAELVADCIVEEIEKGVPGPANGRASSELVHCGEADGSTRAGRRRPAAGTVPCTCPRKNGAIPVVQRAAPAPDAIPRSSPAAPGSC
jgi:hypothetical protein